MFSIGLAEICVILLISVLVIGPEQLPDAARQIGKVVRNFKRLYYELKRDVYDQPFKHNTYQPKSKPVESVYDLPEGIAVPELMDDEDDTLGEENTEPQKPVKKVKSKKKSASKKKKVAVKKKEDESMSEQIYLLPDDGPFGRGTDMENELDLFSHAKSPKEKEGK